MNFSEQELQILKTLEWGHRANQGPQLDGWMRPMDLGAWDASYHSRVLAKLVRLGLVESKRRVVSMMGAMGSNRAGKVYKITEAGLAAIDGKDS